MARLTCLLFGDAGVAPVLERVGGLYLLVRAFVALLIGGVINAWLFLVRLTD